MARRWLLTVLLPVVLVGGYILTPSIGGLVEETWDDFGGPFVFTYWVGLGFTNAWYMVRESMQAQGFGPGMQAATAAIVIFVFVFGFDGPSAFLEDPWLIGVVIAPGIEMMLPYLHRKLAATSQPASPAAEPPDRP